MIKEPMSFNHYYYMYISFSEALTHRPS